VPIEQAQLMKRMHTTLHGETHTEEIMTSQQNGGGGQAVLPNAPKLRRAIFALPLFTSTQTRHNKPV